MEIPLTFKILEYLNSIGDQTSTPLILQANLERTGYGYPSDQRMDDALAVLAKEGYITHDKSETKRKWDRISITTDGVFAFGAVVVSIKTIMEDNGFKDPIN